tara:strand:- start:91 stop:660 length:570 start_codon:yes stop_codon:yes gene_type:complete
MLELIAKQHNAWVGYLINNGCPSSIAEDIVQEMYIKIHKSCATAQKIMFNDDEVNHGYIRVTLMNLYRDYYRSKSRFTVVSLDDNEVEAKKLQQEEYHKAVDAEIELIKENQSDIDFLKRIARAIDSFEDSYNRNAARTYFLSDLTLREVSELSGISLTSLFNSVKHYKAMLVSELGNELTEHLKTRVL